MQVSLIGSSHKEETAIISSGLHEGRKNNAQIIWEYGGTMRNVAHNLALMGLAASFCTKLGNDFDAVQLWNQLNDLDVLMFGPTVDLPTPKKLVILPPDGKPTVFWDRPKDFFFASGDTIPFPIFSQSTVSLTDVKDNLVLAELMKKTNGTRWILSHFIPDRAVLKDVWGLVINYEDAMTLGKPAEFERICYRLCALGPKWVAIYMGYQGVYLYTEGLGTHYPTKCHGQGYANGCYSAFLSGLTAGTALGASLDIAASLGLLAEGITYETPSLINKKISGLLKQAPGLVKQP